MFDLLSDRFIRTISSTGSESAMSLPEVYAALAADLITSFVALRPHQRHPWHALLCQIGALACLAASLTIPPTDAETWHTIIRDLTAEFDENEPWHLVSAEDKPAFLQPPVGPIEALKPLATPDELDMLVTAKNHDLKGARMRDAQGDDWLFALIALQTAEGFLGAGNFGVSRMNGGFSNRPGVGLAPPGGIGAHVFRDIQRMIEDLSNSLTRNFEYDRDGSALLWLLPWNGDVSLAREGLHPYYVEICRRVRLVFKSGRLEARVGNSRVPRIFAAAETVGNTGDPWTPIETKSAVSKALTIDARGFDYRRLSDILFRKGFEAAPLQVFGKDEGGGTWTLVCRALARGQGKTEGYHERRVPIGSPLLRRLESADRPTLGALSQARIAEAAQVRSALRFGLMVLFQNGPDRANYNPRDPASSRRAEPFLAHFGAIVDRDFFEALFLEAETDDIALQTTRRRVWLESLRKSALSVLRKAQATPTAIARRHQALVRAEHAFTRAFYRSAVLKPYFVGIADVA